MNLPFLNRTEELARLRRLFARRAGSLSVLYGRRRCGKSRLLREALPASRFAYYVGDDRESALQRSGVAAEIARLLPGFDRVTYPDWAALFGRFWAEAPRGTILALDEFPALVAVAREIPSLVQKHVDAGAHLGVHVVLAGSSQRLMQGLVLDRSAPLFGRAQEILKIGPLPCGWIQQALRLASSVRAVEAYAVWGGIPRYWELAAECANLDEAVSSLVLSPLGVLHEEPEGLLLDDVRDPTQVASILSLIGRGCHRLSEIAARLQKPATSLSRPLQRLVELDLIRREAPYGVSPRDAKRTLYQIADPFLRFWFRFVDPNRSLLEARQVRTVAEDVRRRLPLHIAGIWEELARASVPRLRCHRRRWKPASRWWGPGLDRRPLEIDVIAESEDGRALLLGEVKWANGRTAPQLLEELRRKAARFPHAGQRPVFTALWLRTSPRRPAGAPVFTPSEVLEALR